MAYFTFLDYALFVVVLLVSFLIGIYYVIKERRQIKETSADDILMGGRDMPVFPVAMSLVASYMSAITVLGIPTEMYVFGSQYYMVAFSGILTYPVTCFLFLPFFHRLRLNSAYQYLELRFNRLTRYLAAGIFSLEMLMYMSVVLYAPALALNQVTGLSLWGSILSVGAVVTFYTSMGGLRAVLWTDTFQTFVVVGGLIGVITMGSRQVGGLYEVWRISNEGGRIEFFDFSISPFQRCTFWGLIIGSFVGQLTIYGANQTMLQRYMSINSVKNAQIALFISLPATILLVTLVCISGLVIYAAYSTCDPYLNGEILARDQLLPYYVMESLGSVPGMPGLFVACIFSASLSSISSCLNALSITLLEDLIKPTMQTFNKVLKPTAEARLAKLLGLVGGIAVIGGAFLSSILGSTVLQIMISVLGMAGGPLLALFLMGMFFPCINAKGAVTGMITCTLVVFWIVIGSFVYHVPQPELPFRTDGCTQSEHFSRVFNVFVTQSMQDLEGFTFSPPVQSSEDNEWNGLKIIYRLSFLWYPTLAIIIAFIVSIFVSIITSWQRKIIESQYVYPVAEKLCCCLPVSFMNCFNCYRIWKYNVGYKTEILTDDEEGEDDVSEDALIKKGNKETARLLPNKSKRIDSFETEIQENMSTTSV